jgi:hypothetical protein
VVTIWVVAESKGRDVAKSYQWINFCFLAELFGTCCDDFRAEVLNLFQTEGARFTLAYRLAGREIINEDNLSKLHSNLLKMLLAYYYEQVPIGLSLDHFLQQNQSLVRYLTLLLLE